MKLFLKDDPLKRYLLNYQYLKKKIHKIFTIGITGSCGKTTTSSYIYYFLRNKIKNICYISTHKIYFNDLIVNTNNTTLEIDKLIEIFNENKINPKVIIMEVSSHGINQARINCFKFDILALTNLGQDHLDYHLNINNYHNVKLSFLNSSVFSKLILINRKYKDKYDFTNKKIRFFDFDNTLLSLFDTLSFNKENMYLAYLILNYLKYDKNEIINFLNTLHLDNGRMQIIKDNNRKIIIDYAHHVQSFEAILNNKNFNKVVIFGCGGNRDKTKRSIMGKIACKYNKYVIITKDNSRNENIDDIIKDITTNITNYKIIKDRKEAIKYAINKYKDLDIYILGKGDESFILENDKKIEHNDKQYVLSIINNHLIKQ